MKFKIEIEETVTYRHTIEVEANSEKEVDEACAGVENGSVLYNGSDYASALEGFGMKDVEFIEDDSGDLPTIECVNIYQPDEESEVEQ